MTALYYLKKASKMPPRTLARKLSARMRRFSAAKRTRLQDRLLPTYETGYRTAAALHQYFTPIEVPPIEPAWEAAIDLFLRHRFDLLGSGWVPVRHGITCAGVMGYRYLRGKAVQPDAKGKWLKGRINPANLRESQRIWSLVDKGYTPIDWQLDFKSGYRWSEKQWYQEVQYGRHPGVDVKVPWELSRMQHLGQFALVYGRTKDDRLVREFRNQVLDFMATNPPRYGVNWKCTMDVGIRVSNWLVAYDLFRSFGVTFDGPFEQLLQRAVYEHAKFITRNLEWNPSLRANHYYADIVGLLFATGYLPDSAEVDSWLAFATDQFLKETKLQFHADGSNFEGSTAYHRLSGEMLVYATALLLALPESKLRALRVPKGRSSYTPRGPAMPKGPLPLYTLPGYKHDVPVPPELLELISLMARFTMAVTRPHGNIIQVGDNDSGRFLKLQPVYDMLTVAAARQLYGNFKDHPADLPANARYPDERYLDHRHLVAAANGILRQAELTDFTGRSWLEQRLLAGVTAALKYKLPVPNMPLSFGDEEQLQATFNRLTGLPAYQRQKIEIPLPAGALEGLETICYVGFGLYIFRSERLYLAVRCGSIGQQGNGGHAHNDQLSLSLVIDGEDVIVDPGTALYTPLPEVRNSYRSTKAHFTPRLGEAEQASLEKGLFTLPDTAKAVCLYAGPKGFVGCHYGYGVPLYRMIVLTPDGLEIMDGVDGDKTLKPLPWPWHTVAVSTGYGKWAADEAR